MPARRPSSAGLVTRLVRRMRADLVLAVLDMVVLWLAMSSALLLRFDGSVPARYWDDGYIHVLPLCLAALLLTNAACGLYGQVWRHASVAEAKRVVTAAVVLAAALLAIDTLVRGHAIPYSVLLVTVVLQTFLGAAIRFASRIFGAAPRPRPRSQSAPRPARRVVVVGAGEAGAALVRDMIRGARWAPRPMQPGAILDDNVRLHGHALFGVRVVGPIADLPDVVRRTGADQIVLAMPSAKQDTVRRVADLAAEVQTTLRVLPGVAQLVHQRVSVDLLREVRIDDLVGRRQVDTDLEDVHLLLRGRRVLVTGAGGSIGSEIVRQVAQCRPAALIALDHDETHLHDLIGSVTQPVIQALADVRDRRAVYEIFRQHQPDVVFHAAAHKHVPVLEQYPYEAMTTNVLGTENVVSAARSVGTSRFVYISTDKAVRPVSVMGASKRLGEQITLRPEIGVTQGLRYCAVRFGNVLGSRGSVVPTFLRQIEAGGPVTVTDPRMTRFFMSIPEAVQLVLQAATMAVGGEVFMLDMGEPVPIVDLAERMIALSGRRDAADIKIEFVGVRPGEKLEEELHAPEEATEATGHPAIVRLQPNLLAAETLQSTLVAMRSVARAADNDGARTALFAALRDVAGAGTGPQARPSNPSVPTLTRSAPQGGADQTEEMQWTPSAS